MNRTVFNALAAALLLPGALLAQSRWVPADLQAAPPFMAGAPTRSVAPTLTAPSLALPTQSTAALFRSRTEARPDLTLKQLS